MLICRSKSRQQRNSIARGGASLQPEVILEIVNAAQHGLTGHEYADRLLELATLSTKWRETLINEKSLWSIIHSEYGHVLASEFLTRARGHPLDVTLSEHDLLQAAYPEHWRNVITKAASFIRSLFWIIDEDHDVESTEEGNADDIDEDGYLQLKECVSRSLDNLRVLKIDRPSLGLEFTLPEENPQAGRAGGRGERAPRGTGSRGGMRRVYAVKTPQPMAPPPVADEDYHFSRWKFIANLERLTLDSATLSLEGLRQILCQTPNLVSLRFGYAWMEERSHSPHSHLPNLVEDSNIARLEKLRELNLSCHPKSGGRFLRFIQAPSLQSLEYWSLHGQGKGDDYAEALCRIAEPIVQAWRGHDVVLNLELSRYYVEKPILKIRGGLRESAMHSSPCLTLELFPPASRDSSVSHACHHILQQLFMTCYDHVTELRYTSAYESHGTKLAALISTLFPAIKMVDNDSVRSLFPACGPVGLGDGESVGIMLK